MSTANVDRAEVAKFDALASRWLGMIHSFLS